VADLKPFAVLLVLLVFVLTLSMFKTSALSENVVASDIERAEGVMLTAYLAVLEAEEAGANVSGLLAQLNVAGDGLAQAYVLYRLGDFDNADRFADLCSEISERVRADALKLRDQAILDADQRFRWTKTGSIIGVVAILCLCFLGWRAFKRSYYQRVLRMRPEVVSGEP